MKISQVKRIYNHNFDKYKEIGCSLCVIVDGEVVIDIWAGHKNKEKTKEWDEILFLLLFQVLKLHWLYVLNIN